MFLGTDDAEQHQCLFGRHSDTVNEADWRRGRVGKVLLSRKSIRTFLPGSRVVEGVKGRLMVVGTKCDNFPPVFLNVSRALVLLPNRWRRRIQRMCGERWRDVNVTAAEQLEVENSIQLRPSEFFFNLEKKKWTDVTFCGFHVDTQDTSSSLMNSAEVSAQWCFTDARCGVTEGARLFK